MDKCAFEFPTRHPDPHSDRNIPDEARGQICGKPRKYPEQAYCERFGVHHDFTPAKPKRLTDATAARATQAGAPQINTTATLIAASRRLAPTHSQNPTVSADSLGSNLHRAHEIMRKYGIPTRD